jgi:predicted KAP-like P-loop ATPase
MRSGDTFEVNPLDLIAIESLRLFEPSVYEAIAENRVLFVGRGPFHRLGLEEDTKTSTRTNLDRILRVVPDARRGRVSEILKQLFPVLFGHQHPDGESLLRQLRVGHHLMFDRYFTLSIANDDVSQAELDTLRKCIENSNDFAAVCSTLANQGKLELAFERLDAYKATFPTSAFPAAITTLCDIGDSLPYVPFSSAWGLKFDPLVYVWRIVHFSLKSIQSENSRYELLRSGIAASQGVRVAVEIVQNQERVGNRNEEDFQITQEHCEDLKLLALQRLRSAAVDGRLHDMPGLTQLLGQWKAWGSESEVRQWLVKNTQDSTGALWFLRLSMSKMQMSTTSRAKEIHYINLTDLSILGEIDKLATLTQELKIDELGEDDRRALRAYRHALIWKEEGKPAAYYGGDDGPLSEDV